MNFYIRKTIKKIPGLFKNGEKQSPNSREIPRNSQKFSENGIRLQIKHHFNA